MVHEVSGLTGRFPGKNSTGFVQFSILGSRLCEDSMVSKRRLDPTMTRLLGLLLCCLMSAPVLADEMIYRCRDSSGELSFSDYPCPQGSKTEGKRGIQEAPRPVKGDTAGIVALCGADGAWNMNRDFSDEFRAQLPAAQRRALETALSGLLADSDQGSPVRWRRSDRGDLHLCTRSKRNMPVETVAAEDGAVVMFRNGVGQYLNDPQTPDALTQRCSSLVTGCFSPPETSIDSCVHLAPVCTTVPAWEQAEACCPQLCKDRFADRRADGEEALPAFLAVLHEPPGCVR